MFFPIAIETGNENYAYSVAFPSIDGCYSAGDTLDEAIYNAKEAIELFFEVMAEDGIIPPSAITLEEAAKFEEYQDWKLTVIDIDMEPYLGKSSKINVTMPNLLSKKIDDVVKTNPKYKNRSSFLQLATMHELGLTEV
ncbi:type II toxin-antitoxin system HicB family antitoxin [Psychromonas arctica]|uniref:type II toxin-antitoxin system HicB family antitoxin n=1 Tax=Psychromonas arctica TaxID=168275 RepID=UPI002FD43D84